MSGCIMRMQYAYAALPDKAALRDISRLAVLPRDRR